MTTCEEEQPLQISHSKISPHKPLSAIHSRLLTVLTINKLPINTIHSDVINMSMLITLISSLKSLS